MRGIDAPARRGLSLLRDGRSLGWSEWGPEAGRPVLFCPGAGTSSALGFATDRLDGLGVRLVGIDRPGLGRSDPRADRTLLDFADDVADLARARGLGRPAIVGFSQGAPFALVCAAQGVVSSVTIVSGADEIARAPARDRLPAELSRLVALAEADPPAAERLFGGMSPASLFGMIEAGSPPVDLAVYQEPSFRAAFMAALEEGFGQGAAGYARDTVLAMRRWPFDPVTIAVPVTLVYGALDGSPVHALDLGEELASRIPGARRRVVPGAGGSVLWTHGAEILAALPAP